MAFSTASPNTVVAAMATTSEGQIDGAVTANTSRGLYTSLDAGQTWTYSALTDPGGSATDATSATTVVYNASAGKFFAAVRYHGFYSSPDGVNWTRLATQPGTQLTTTACPPQSTSNNYACPIYRAEITVVPGRNEMYAWFTYYSSPGSPTDGGIWQSLNGGTSWTSISDASITNCGDPAGCGVEQGATISNCSPFPTPLAPTSTLGPSTSTNVRSPRRIRPARLRRSSTSLTFTDAIPSPPPPTCIPTSMPSPT